MHAESVFETPIVFDFNYNPVIRFLISKPQIYFFFELRWDVDSLLQDFSD